jgi:hypothetical protein
MSELSVADYYVTRMFLAVLDSVSASFAAATGLSEKERVRAIIACSVPYLQYKSEDGKAARPIAFLSKYLAGSGEDEPIDLYTMLAEDKGVRGSVYRQITSVLRQQQFFRTTGIDMSNSGRLSHAKAAGKTDDPTSYKQKLSAFQSRELLLDVPQPDFQVNDWRNAVGSFNLNWSLIDVSSDRKSVFAELWGTNTYRWHPEVSRKSQLIHQAAERMKEFGAKEFKMVFRPCLISIATGDLARI